MNGLHLTPRSTALVFGAVASLFLIAGCAPSYSPNTYASNAVQLANKVEAGAIVGYREVAISANGTIGTVAGGAAGGLLASEHSDSALAALAGSTVGAIVGRTLEHVAGDTTGWEYIVRKANSEMVSVTQREKTPLVLGQKVLVIMGPQARVVPDYSVAEEKPPEPAQKAAAKPESKPETPVKVEVVLSLPPGITAQAASGQATVVTGTSPVTVPVAVVPAASENEPMSLQVATPSAEQVVAPAVQHFIVPVADQIAEHPVQQASVPVTEVPAADSVQSAASATALEKTAQAPDAVGH